MDEKRQKTINISLRDSAVPFDLEKYPKVKVPKISNDEDESSSADNSEEQEKSDSD